jgi:hypothetical protein
MKALGAIGTLPHLRLGHVRKAEKQSEPADRVKMRAKRSHQDMEGWAAWEADPTLAAMAMLRMLGH